MKNIAIDDLTFDTKVFSVYSKDQNTKETLGVVVHGLYIQGASWNVKNKMLKEPDFGELQMEIPCIHLLPIEKHKHIVKNCYECPLYKTSRRAGELSTTGHSTNFVMYFYLLTNQDPDHWIRRGTAFLTQLDE